MASPSDVLRVAASQVGVCEKPSGSNCVKYNTWFYGKKVSGSDYSWCATFIVWCFYKAGLLNLVTKNASAAYIQDDIVNKRGGSWIMRKNKSEDARRAYLAKAKPGDIVSFDFGRYDAWRSHVGILKEVSGDYLILYEGNTSKKRSQSNGGMVCEQRRIYTSACSAVRPKWSGVEPEPFKPLEVDGQFGVMTKMRLQRWLNVTEDAEIGKTTVRALQKKIGMNSKDIDGEWGRVTTRALQTYLTRQGFPVMVDGVRGKATIKALQKFLNREVTK